MEIVINIPEVYYEALRKTDVIISGQRSGKTLTSVIFDAVANGTPLPKGHGALKDENYLLSILRCKEYETCTWRNCSDCNREKCLKRHDVLDAPTIIEADKSESEE